MNEEIKEILIKDFNEILVKEFCTDWKEKRLYIELLVNSTPFSNLLDYITNLQRERDNYKTSLDESQEVVIDLQKRIDKAIEYIKTQKIIFDDYDIVIEQQLDNLLKMLNGEKNER